jgi:SAM-dependent methyltransferase
MTSLPNSNLSPIILDLGCGRKKRPGSIGVDHTDKLSADVLHDLNVFPYPFESDAADEVYMDNVLEHLDEPMRVMEEVYRIVRPGGTVKVIVPYFRSKWAFIDPTHRHYFTVDSFAYYDPRNEICIRYAYTDARFLVEKVIFNETLKNSPMKQLLMKLANRYPGKYEYYLSHLFPLDDITFYLKKC